MKDILMDRGRSGTSAFEATDGLKDHAVEFVNNRLAQLNHAPVKSFEEIPDLARSEATEQVFEDVKTEMQAVLRKQGNDRFTW